MVWGHVEPRVPKTHVADDITMSASRRPEETLLYPAKKLGTKEAEVR
jgi:hypothetical protein